MEEQLTLLTALMKQQMVQAQQREERLTAVLEGLAGIGQAESGGAAASTGGTPSSLVTPRHVKLPHNATPAPHLTSSASLREFDAWRHKFEGYVKLTGINAIPPSEQKSALVSLLDDDWTRTLRYGLTVADGADLETILDAMEAHLRNQRNVVVDRR